MMLPTMPANVGCVASRFAFAAGRANGQFTAPPHNAVPDAADCRTVRFAKQGMNIGHRALQRKPRLGTDVRASGALLVQPRCVAPLSDWSAIAFSPIPGPRPVGSRGPPRCVRMAKDMQLPACAREAVEHGLKAATRPSPQTERAVGVFIGASAPRTGIQGDAALNRGVRLGRNTAADL